MECLGSARVLSAEVQIFLSPAQKDGTLSPSRKSQACLREIYQPDYRSIGQSKQSAEQESRAATV